MPPDSRADGPCGPKARRTRGPASPGQRTAQPFGGTLNASPPCVVRRGHRSPAGVRQALRRPPYTRGIGPTRGFRGPCRPPHAGDIGPRGRSAGLPPYAAARGASASRGRSAGLPPHAGPRPSRAFRGPRRPPPTRGIGPRGGSAGLPPPAAAHGASALAGVPQASRRTPPHAGHRPPPAFRRPPAGRHHKRGIGPRGRSVAHAARRPRGASALAAHAALAGVSQAARARSQPAPAARFSRKPPCGIGSRMVYCT